MGKETKKEEKRKSKKLIIFILCLVIIGGSVFAGVYIGLNKNKDAAMETVIEQAYFDLGEFFVNLNDEGGKRYVKLTASVSYNVKDKDLAQEIESNKVALRDTAIFYFKSLNAKDFSPENEVNLKTELIKQLNKNLKSGLLIDVKFNELLIQ